MPRHASASARDPRLRAATRAIIDVGRLCSARHMMPATSGNLSVRIDERSAAVTRSGTDKGGLTPRDILLARIDSPPPEGASAETELHLSLYRLRPEIGAVVHAHADAAAILGRLLEGQGTLTLRGWELQKALRGCRSHETEVHLPILSNSQDVPALGMQAEARIAGDPLCPGYLIAGHGFYTWGRDMDEAARHAVALDHLLACELELRRLSR